MTGNVKIIIGSHGSGKSDWIYNRFLDISRNETDKKKIDLDKKLYLVVPEQDTNEKQRTMMKKSLEKDYGAGIINIDVVSFDRIAHNVFDILNIEPIKENVIDDDMKTMILSLILSKLAKANKLKYCNRMVNRVGFARKLTQVVSEFYAYSVDGEEIDKVIADKKSDIYRDKLNDFKLIFEEFKKVLIDMHFSIKEDKYDLLNKRINDVDIFKDAIVAFDGFTGFTPIQLSIFEQIANVAKEVYVTVDYRNPEEIKTFNLDSNPDDSDVFYLSKKFIKDIAKAVSAKSIDDILFDESIRSKVYKYNEKKQDLSLIEKKLYEIDEKCDDKVKIDNIEYYEASDLDEEVENVIQRIFDLVRCDGYKYNDIKIVVPQIDEYRDVIIKKFNKYHIPLFIDDSEGILTSPYIETIRAAIDVLNYNFSYESVMRYINSGLIEKDRKTYEFDNFILEHAIKGYDRYKYGFDKIKVIDETIKANVLKVKETFITPLIKMYDEVKDDKSIGNYINAVVNFMKNTVLAEKYDELDKQVEDLASKDSSYNRISAILKYSKEVIDNTINDLINLEKYKAKDSDKYITSNIEIEDFRRVLDVSLSNKALKSIPFSLDQVVVGDLMRSRFDNPKVEFFIGLNQSAIPAKSLDLNLIDDAIRELFANNVKELSQTTIETTLNQRFYTYLVLTNPTQKLILSYTKVNHDGDADEKSSVLIMIEKLFNTDENNRRLFPKKVDPDTFKFYNFDDLISYVAVNMQDIKRFGLKNQEGKYLYEFPEETSRRVARSKVILKYLKKNENFKYISENIFDQPRFYKDTKLNSEINNDLLNSKDRSFMGSASSIEKYNNCPFRFYMEYLLNLKENIEYKVEAFNIGNIAHRVFNSLFKDKKISEKSAEDIHKKIDTALEKAYAVEDVFNEFNKTDKNFMGANKLEYIKSRITDIMYRSTDVLLDMSKAMKFKTDETEYAFEYDINENSKTLDKLDISGKIDRIDVCDIDGKTYVNVIDYKSGKKEKTLDLKDVENGTNIQLTLYLDYCLSKKYKKNGVKPIFAGSFYFWVGEGRTRVEDYVEGINTKDSLIERLRSNVGYTGVSSSDAEVLKEVYDNPVIDVNSKGSISSVSIGRGYKLDGNYLSNEKLDELINTMHNKVNETINNIKAGVITAKPVTDKNCAYCPYSNICRKEQLIKGDDEEIGT